MRAMVTFKFAVICAAIGLCASPAIAATTWKVQIWGPKRASMVPLEWYAEEVATRTGGQMKIDIAYDKGKVTDAVGLLQSGGADGAFVCTQFFTEKMRLLTLLDLPMISPDSLAAVGRVELAVADHPAVEAELRKSNIKLLLPTVLPQYQFMGTRRLSKIEDFQGAKVRISPEMGRVLGEYGAEVIKTSTAEAAGALKEGKLDLVALPYPYAFVTNKVDDVSKYVTDNISLGSALCYIGVSEKSWEALPPNVKKVMSDLREPAVARYEQAYAVEDAAQIARFKERGLEFVSFNPADRTRLVAKSIKVWNAWIEEREKEGLPGRELFIFTQGKIREYGHK
ncbi:MAG TPA: TRAP transporter substrate-binding protein DctP [Usitatibacter sp.]|jgi:TRAP-type C4-dicarboxylate transport system substrate-binding protein